MDGKIFKKNEYGFRIARKMGIGDIIMWVIVATIKSFVKCVSYYSILKYDYMVNVIFSMKCVCNNFAMYATTRITVFLPHAMNLS